MKKTSLLLLLFSLFLAYSKSIYAQACPDGDFENWNITTYPQPDSMWYTSNSQSLLQADSLTGWQVTGFSGQAVHMQSAVVGTDSLMAYIENGIGNPMAGQGGVPYSQQPTAITGYYRYNMVAGDSAIIFALFKKAGVPISVNVFKISNTTGSLSTFTAFSLPLATLSVTPDSIIIAATSSNILTGGPIHPGSWLELDQLAFAGTGITQPIPGGSFNSWAVDSLFSPVGWNVGESGNGVSGITRSTNHYSGDYSVELVSQSNGGGGGGTSSEPVSPAQMTTGTFSKDSGPIGGLPYTRMTDTLTGYYMYMPSGTDTGGLQISLYAAGANIGDNGYRFTSATTWTPFSVLIDASSTPDTMRIDISSSIGSATIPGSTLYLDHLQLSSQPLPPSGINVISAAAYKVIAYPNPANDILNLRLAGNISGKVSARIYDMMGRVLDQRSWNVAPSIITFPVGYLPTGLYFYEVMNNGNIIRNKFLKE